MNFQNLEKLQDRINALAPFPSSSGSIEMIIIRPKEGERKSLETGYLDLERGLVGDSWYERSKNKPNSKFPALDTQLTLMNSKIIHIIAETKERWPLAGDQVYVDLDLSKKNLPPGTQLKIGDAIIEITAQPHHGCKSFATRYGLDAMRLVNSKKGRENRYRGVNAKIIVAGEFKLGDVVTRIDVS